MKESDPVQTFIRVVFFGISIFVLFAWLMRHFGGENLIK